MDEISLKAPAKINLYLKVLGKRPDGYHEIESLMQAVDLYDDITLEKSDTIDLVCDDPNLPLDATNLALRAALELQERFYFPGVRIDLRKRIPQGAGLGGGSSDAAFVLRGLCRLYQLSPSSAELNAIAADIGSDVPFFLGTGQALALGRGEIIRPVALPTAYSIVIAVPPWRTSTSEIYGKSKIGLTRVRDDILLQKKIRISRFQNLVKRFSNDLEEVVLGEFPGLPGLKEELRSTGADFCSMSGSGSAVFGIFFSNAKKREKLAGRVKTGTRIFECRPVILPPFSVG